MSNCFLSLLGATLLATVAHGGVIVDTTLSGFPGAYLYSYEVENQTAVGIFAFSVTVTGDVGIIESPSGWSALTGVPGPGETLVQWVDLDVPYDVPPFGNLSGFSLASTDGQGIASFSTLDESFSEFDGATTGPVSPVSSPEPASFILAASALAIGVQIRRHT
jgi:hypothetical protein